MPPRIRFLPSRQNSAEPNYDVNAPVDYWAPAGLGIESKDPHWSVIARLRDGVTLEGAQAELTAIAARQAKADADLEGTTAKVELLTLELNRDGRRVLLPLLGAVALVFLIACANVAGLQLARGLQRQGEYSVRSALGAQPLQLFRQVLTEGALLAAVGSGLGIGLAIALVKVIKVVGGHAIPRVDAVVLGWPVLLFCFGSAIAAVLLAGLAPAFHACLDASDGLKGTRTSTLGRTERRVLGAVAILQTALTLALLVGAGLLIRTVNHLAEVRLGYDIQNLLTMNVTMPDTKKFADFHAQALTRISALPGVKKVAFGWGVPLTGNNWMNQVRIDGQSDSDAGTGKDFKNEVAIATRSVSPDYFEALGLSLIMGRGFRPNDAWYGPDAVTNAPFVAIINQSMAMKYFDNRNPVGSKLRFSPGIGQSAQIIGVITDARTASLTEKPEPEVYFSLWQLGPFTKHLVIRTSSEPRLLIGPVQRELRAIDPIVAVERVKTLQQIRDESVASQTFAMRLLVGFSIAGTILAIVGIYGVLSLSVASRKQELAIRAAVGARRGDLLGLVLREGLGLVAGGLLLGVVVAVVMTRLLRGLLYGVESTDPMTFVAVAILFTAVSLLACLVPALRATRVDPMTALRYE
jgi:predicted permease